MRDAHIQSLGLQVVHIWDQLLHNNGFDASRAFHIIYFPHWSQKIPDALNASLMFFLMGHVCIMYNLICQILWKYIHGMCRTNGS